MGLVWAGFWGPLGFLGGVGPPPPLGTALAVITIKCAVTI